MLAKRLIRYVELFIRKVCLVVINIQNYYKQTQIHFEQTSSVCYNINDEKKNHLVWQHHKICGKRIYTQYSTNFIVFELKNEMSILMKPTHNFQVNWFLIFYWQLDFWFLVKRNKRKTIKMSANLNW